MEAFACSSQRLIEIKPLDELDFRDLWILVEEKIQVESPN
jgi:hypothetical protein